MKKFSEKFYKQSTSIKLKTDERRELRERLLSYMEYHPLPAHMRQPVAAKTNMTDKVLSPLSSLFLNATFIRAGVSTLALFLVIIPFVAEKSLPGDVLYPVKIQFNEEVRSSLSFSSYAKVEWETERLERRISEARLLASEGKLTSEVEAEVAQAVKDHSDKAQQEIATLRESDEDEAALAEITLASALAVQSEVLEGHMTGDVDSEGVGRSVAVLAGAVAAVQQQAEASEIGANPSYEKLLARLELETTKAYELFDSVSDYASPEEVENIKTRLQTLEQKMNKAIALHDAPVVEETTEVVANEEELVPVDAEVATGTDSVTIEGDTAAATSTDETSVTATTTEEVDVKVTEPVVVEKDAKQLLREALIDTRKLISFMSDIDVRATVKIEDLVPAEEVTETESEPESEVTDTVTGDAASDTDETSVEDTEDIATSTEEAVEN